MMNEVKNKKRTLLKGNTGIIMHHSGPTLTNHSPSLLRLNPHYFSPKPIIHPPPCWVHRLTFFPTDRYIHMLVFGNPACHLRPIRARQVFLPEVIIKRCGEDEEGVGRNRVGDEKRERERRGGGLGGAASVKQGLLSRFKEGFSHYDSATEYCILQRPYYNGLLAFMMPFTLPSPTPAWKTGRGYVAWTPGRSQR